MNDAFSATCNAPLVDIMKGDACWWRSSFGPMCPKRRAAHQPSISRAPHLAEAVTPPKGLSRHKLRALRVLVIPRSPWVPRHLRHMRIDARPIRRLTSKPDEAHSGRCPDKEAASGHDLYLAPQKGGRCAPSPRASKQAHDRRCGQVRSSMVALNTKNTIKVRRVLCGKLQRKKGQCSWVLFLLLRCN